MKVERQPSPFVPITITLQTKEEADFMWHLTNAAEANSLEEYLSRYNVEKGVLTFKNKLWHEMDREMH